MWIVRLALRRPYTVATLCLLILLMGVLSVTRMRTDVLPSINISVVVVVWSDSGLSAEDMGRRVTLVAERGYSTTLDDIEHIDSQSMCGIGLIRTYMDPDADIRAAIAQITAQSMQSLRFMPPGMTPPNILQFNASNVPAPSSPSPATSSRRWRSSTTPRASSASSSSPSPPCSRRLRTAARAGRCASTSTSRSWPRSSSRPPTR